MCFDIKIRHMQEMRNRLRAGLDEAMQAIGKSCILQSKFGLVFLISILLGVKYKVNGPLQEQDQLPNTLSISFKGQVHFSFWLLNSSNPQTCGLNLFHLPIPPIKRLKITVGNTIWLLPIGLRPTHCSPRYKIKWRHQLVIKRISHSHYVCDN